MNPTPIPKLQQMLDALRKSKLQTPSPISEAVQTLTLPHPACSSFCAPGENCSVSNDGKCDALKHKEETVTNIPTIPTPANSNEITDKYGNLITLNSKQMEAVNRGGAGESIVIIGAAGTGKTTSQKALVNRLIDNGIAGLLDPMGHKHLRANVPGIVITAYTRRATANIRRNVSADMQDNCITIHKLLEYQPVYDEVFDTESGETKTKMSFKATRHAGNPLPSSIRVIILEESSMVGTSLFQEIVDACPHNPQFIFLGDIQQLPPVFGPAILGFKLLELPVIELTEVYRQALESPIIRLAHRILSGNKILEKEFPEWKIKGQLTLHPWKKKIEAGVACSTAGQFFIKAHQEGGYDPEEDTILCPFNKSFGTDELNKIIANHLSHTRGADVYEVIAGFNKHYLSPGDKILFDKLDATIISINPNPGYAGKKAQHHSPTMDYWGYDPEAHKYIGQSEGDFDVDFILTSAASAVDERTAQCSHILEIQFTDSEVKQKITKAADVNSLSLGYALTVHKAQGSEWRKVFLVLHQSHNTMIQRELLYTAVTRAREELYVICEPDHFIKGIESQRIKGNTIAEKAEFFKGKISSEDERM